MKTDMEQGLHQFDHVLKANLVSNNSLIFSQKYTLISFLSNQVQMQSATNSNFSKLFAIDKQIKQKMVIYPNECSHNEFRLNFSYFRIKWNARTMSFQAP